MRRLSSTWCDLQDKYSSEQTARKGRSKFSRANERTKNIYESSNTENIRREKDEIVNRRKLELLWILTILTYVSKNTLKTLVAQSLKIVKMK